jgi:hypothetical protein
MTTWKLVPVEPTHNMILAGSLDSRMTPSMADSSYKAMLNSAPAPDVHPVAWMNVFDDVNRGSFGTPADTHLELDEAEQQINRQKAKGLCALRTIPLYTHPPAPQLRPLTEDETMHLMNETAGRQHWADEAHIQRFRKAVERAHGIGEGKV